MRNGKGTHPSTASAIGAKDAAPLSILVNARFLEKIISEISNDIETLLTPDDLNVTDIDLKTAVDEYEVKLIRIALNQAGGKQCAAARLLRLKPSTLCTKMKKFGIVARAAAY